MWTECVAHTHRNVARCNRYQGAWVQHLCPKPGEARCLRVREMWQQARILDQAWISGQHTINIGIDRDLDAIKGCPDNRSGIVGTIAPQRGHKASDGATYETRRDRHDAMFDERIDERVSIFPRLVHQWISPDHHTKGL